MKPLAAIPVLVATALCLVSCKGPGKKEENAEAKVSFQADIKPFFESSCLSCHHSGVLLGHLNLENRQLAFTSGPNGPFIVPGKPSESLMYKALLLPKVKDEAMPPPGHRMEQSEIRLIHDWILEGADWPEGEAGRLLLAGKKAPPA